MKRMHSFLNRRYIRVATILLALMMFLTLAASCASRPLPTTEEDLAVVGHVGEYEVYYEELRFITMIHKTQLASRYGANIWDSAETISEYLPELERLIREDLLVNYAVLALAAKEGIHIEDFQDQVQEYMERMLENDFGGRRSAYKEMLQISNLTDHYLRFTVGVDLVYNELQNRYLESGKIPSDEGAVKQYILKNFVRVKSICIPNKDADEVDSNKVKIDGFRQEVLDGADIEDYVKYTLDLSPEHCFTRGEMNEIFETHAFALENPGDISEVFLDDVARYDSAWYFMQRMELDLAYVNKNYEDLFDQYVAASMNDALKNERSALSYVPNEYGQTIKALEVPQLERVVDNTWIFVLITVLGIALVGGGVVVLIRVLNRKPEPPVHPASKTLPRKKS